MKLKNKWALCMLFLPILLQAQITFPSAQIKDPQNSRFAITNAFIQLDENTLIPNATLLIKDGYIVACGAGISIPKGTQVINVQGAYIYPAFIDPSSTYGVQTPAEKDKKIPAASGWNPAIRPYVDAADLFSMDDKRSESLLEMGFGATASMVKDGIARGTASLVLTGSGKENELILRRQVAAHYSFNKGSSSQAYPSSLMGSIALLRQTYYDADWYAKGGNKEEHNASLERMNQLQSLPQIFEVDNKLSALRALKIAKEFNKNYIIRGAGDEYQLADFFKSNQAKFIIPLRLPKAYIVTSASRERISTKDLRHWYMAPFNPSVLAKQGVDFSFTAEGLQDAPEFWKNIRLMMQCGLDEKALIKALCSNPAKYLGATDLIGSLKPGRLASFIICSAPISKDECLPLETWVMGKRNILKAFRQKKFEGSYVFAEGKISIKANEFTLIRDGDTCRAAWENIQEKNAASLSCRCSDQSVQQLQFWTSSLSSKYPEQANELKVIFRNNVFTAARTAEKDSSKQKKKIVLRDSLPQVVAPFTDYGQTQKPPQSYMLFKNATVWSGEAEGILNNTDVAIGNGKIISIGKNLDAAKVFGKNSYQSVDATGRHLTAGIIDEHSHIAIEKGVNECTQSVTAEVRIADVIDNEDINIYRQLAGGVTSSHLLHGSCNPIGGQTQLIKLRWGEMPEQMKFEGWGGFIKFALGENVKQSNWGPTTRFPQTRMGVEQTILDAFDRAKQYAKAKELATKNKSPFRMDLELEAVLEILNRQRFITCHSYVQSEINMLINLADSAGFKVNTFTHVLEGYKVAEQIKAHGAAASTFADWWAYKYEVIDAIPQNACILNSTGIVTSINSDDAEMGRRLNQEAAKSLKYCGMSREDAWKMVTLNPARMLHVDGRTGSIKAGKDADLVLWSADPLSIYARAEKTFVDGKCYYDAQDEKAKNLLLQKEREWLLLKMMEAKKSGEEATDGVSAPPDNYHCED